VEFSIDFFLEFSIDFSYDNKHQNESQHTTSSIRTNPNMRQQASERSPIYKNKPQNESQHTTSIRTNPNIRQQASERIPTYDQFDQASERIRTYDNTRKQASEQIPTYDQLDQASERIPTYNIQQQASERIPAYDNKHQNKSQHTTAKHQKESQPTTSKHTYITNYNELKHFYNNIHSVVQLAGRLSPQVLVLRGLCEWGLTLPFFPWFLYEEERFAGIVVDLPGHEATVMIKSMAMCGVVLWKWPEKDDVLSYPAKDVIRVLNNPVPAPGTSSTRSTKFSFEDF